MNVDVCLFLLFTNFGGNDEGGMLYQPMAVFRKPATRHN